MWRNGSMADDSPPTEPSCHSKIDQLRQKVRDRVAKTVAMSEPPRSRANAEDAVPIAYAIAAEPGSAGTGHDKARKAGATPDETEAFMQARERARKMLGAERASKHPNKEANARQDPEPEPETVNTEPASAARSLAMVAAAHSVRPGGVPLVDNWVLRNGRGKMRTSVLKSGIQTTTIESYRDQEAFYIATHEPPASETTECVWRGSYQLDVALKCMREPGTRASQQRVYVVCDVQLGQRGEPGTFCACVLDIDAREVRVERYGTSGHDTLGIAQLSGLKANVWYRLHLQVHDKVAQLNVNGETLLKDIELDAGGGGLLGLALYQCKAQFRQWEVKKLTAAMMRRQYTGDDDPKLVEMIQRDIISQDVGVSFEDIAALDSAKELLNEAVVLPLVIPEFFTGIREPWKGVLLFGPPGTGKTMLAKAVASMNGLAFFNCSASSLVSKWRGESEKLVRVLFNMARFYSPSIVFIDEIDALVASRSGADEHEASRRMKSEIFTQIDGMPSALHNGGLMMVLATTNCPWDLDEALRRRLEKRIYIPLPDVASCETMFRLHLRDIRIESESGEAALPLVDTAQTKHNRPCSTVQVLTLVQAASKMKEELGVAQDLNASDAVKAAAESIGIELPDGLTLKEKIATVCKEAGIELGWDVKAKADDTAEVRAESCASGADSGSSDPDDVGQGLFSLAPKLAAMAQGYSGADIKLICRDAAMAPMRRAIVGKTPDQIRQMKERGELDVGLRLSDFEGSFQRIQPSVSGLDGARYEAWATEFGST